MREFILRASKAFTKPFKLNDLPGAGRMDLVCRCVTNALWTSHALRRDVVFHAVLEGPDTPPKILSFDGRALVGISVDERNIASNIRRALERGYDLKLNEEICLPNGIKIVKRSFESLVKEKSKKTQLFYLHKEGENIRNIKFTENVCFVVGDHVGLSPASEKLLKRLGAKKVSLGKIEYLASSCIAICNYELDRIL